MPGRHWTMLADAAYGPAVTHSPAVVTVGPLMPDLVAALEDLNGIDEACASFMVGAALHAKILAGEDTAPDAILRLAERATCWQQGQESVLLVPGTKG